MEKYRAHVRPDVPEPEPARKSTKVDLGQLTRDYGLSDMFDFSSNLCEDQTVEEEFLAYTRGRVDGSGCPDKEILEFWEVSIRTMHYHLDLDLRSIGQGSHVPHIIRNCTRLPTYPGVSSSM